MCVFMNVLRAHRYPAESGVVKKKITQWEAVSMLHMLPLHSPSPRSQSVCGHELQTVNERNNNEFVLKSA